MIALRLFRSCCCCHHHQQAVAVAAVVAFAVGAVVAVHPATVTYAAASSEFSIQSIPRPHIPLF